MVIPMNLNETIHPEVSSEGAALMREMESESAPWDRSGRRARAGVGRPCPCFGRGTT